MRIDRAGLPFIAGFLVPAVVLFALGYAIAALVFLAIAAFVTFFFRDPERRAPAGEHLVIAPADGRVMAAGAADPASAPPGPWKQITIFLSPMDVHVNRMPVSGTVTRVDYCPGRFLPAYKPESSLNERTELWIDHGGQTVVVRQVVGVLARRVVCRVAQGERVTAGQRFGLMKFGSRMDVFLPPSARLRVRPGARVRGGETVMAEL
ncbi:MAG TPA: phosphatidylserine decarboxylase [Vicinamibacterales bacterium]|nr:phosphatidylserine decarboxylase [Vicinamibacterales bacterium]